MSNINFRLAKPSDAKQIADCHWHVRDRYTQGIFLSLGKRFLVSYYEVILNDPYEVVVCAERGGKIVGFSSATMNAQFQAKNLRAHLFKLGFAAVGAILMKPTYLKELWIRYKSLSSDNKGQEFVHAEGVRGEYWCWLKSDTEDPNNAVQMNEMKYRILYDLGVREMFFEVDKFNKRVYKFHLKINKAETIEEITLPDGRQRVLMKKILNY